MTDALTELANRRAFDDLVAMEAAAVDRGGEPFCIARIDLDRFKSVNDQHGHDAGDLLLTGLAGAMRASIRGSDVAARIGGDEFALLLRSCPIEEAVAICERVRERLAAVRVAGADDLSATASMGVAELRDGGSLSEALARADEALYAAKRRGGNWVVAADALRTR
jgi:diguanylate cyclase (GGDEF)-like protein